MAGVIFGEEVADIAFSAGIDASASLTVGTAGQAGFIIGGEIKPSLAAQAREGVSDTLASHAVEGLLGAADALVAVEVGVVGAGGAVGGGHPAFRAGAQTGRACVFLIHKVATVARQARIGVFAVLTVGQTSLTLAESAHRKARSTLLASRASAAGQAVLGAPSAGTNVRNIVAV